ncbi:lipopolysaccharide assembly protein LapA domain-containing protein [Streptococcus caprae]|uniref:Lipopolysaccharide assembly protein LapA domain-containing protein n=1 Tax=Streptococcus caprae TaxID=1640501 RepID=A0ABV8CWC7_9STRE
MKKNLTILLLIITIIATAALALANRQYVEVNYLFGSFRSPLILLILVSVLLGIIIQFLLTFPKNLANARQLKHVRREMEDVKRALGEQQKPVEPVEIPSEEEE